MNLLNGTVCIILLVWFSLYPLRSVAKEILHQDVNFFELSEEDEDTSITDSNDTFLEDCIREYLTYSVKSLLFQNFISTSDSSQNPDNAFLLQQRYSTELHVRPNVYFTFPFLTGMFKPRLISYYRRWEDGPLKDENKTHTKAFINEFMVQAELNPTLFMSYSKERLLWGPSFLSSPSNPFYLGDERRNPKNELVGKYFFKINYLPTDMLSLTWISLLDYSKDNGNQVPNFSPIHAIKTDIVGESYMISLIGSRKKEDDHRLQLGSYGQWTVSDSVLLYYDGKIMSGTDNLFPDADNNHPLKGELKMKYEDSDKIFTNFVVGGSYTTKAGATLSLEYLYNNLGYNDSQMDDYLEIRKSSADHFIDNSPLSGLATKNLRESITTGNQFIKRHYLMFQYQRRQIKDVFDLILRYTSDLQDGSGLLVTIAELGISDNLQLFNINNIGFGSLEDEFKSTFKASIVLGLEFTF
ncbi:MAG: hypothetical protein GY777_05490 [Candidatus Brocadiaceae bacterium]|nr:hypothetical protein [Candidatus Brocadiaceae bacterium]